jgi:hypothetical protein
MPCIRSIPTPQAFDAATAGLTTKITEDFTRVQPSGDPTPPDLYSGIPGNYFFWYTEVVFDSVGASDQQYPSGSGIPYVGQRHPTVVGLGNDGAGPTISSSAGGGNYSGYDGIGARFTNGQTAVGLTTDVETAGRSFTLVVKGTDGTTLAQLAISGGNASFAGAERVCGPPIGAVDLLPNRIAGGEHGTFYWEMRSVRLAR